MFDEEICWMKTKKDWYASLKCRYNSKVIKISLLREGCLNKVVQRSYNLPDFVLMNDN